MANDYRPLIEILRDLKSLALKKASGFFFVVTEDNHSCTIRLRGGQIEDVVFSRHRSDDAVHLLATVPAGRARFQADPASTGTPKVSLSEASLRWLMGGFENAPPPIDTPTRTPSASGDAADVTASQRETIERIALNYLGPIAGMLCDEAFEGGGNLSGCWYRSPPTCPIRMKNVAFSARCARRWAWGRPEPLSAVRRPEGHIIGVAANRRVLGDGCPPLPGRRLYCPGHRHAPSGLQAWVQQVRQSRLSKAQSAP